MRKTPYLVYYRKVLHFPSFRCDGEIEILAKRKLQEEMNKLRDQITVLLVEKDDKV